MQPWEKLVCGIFALVVSNVNGLPDFSGLPAGPYCADRYLSGECCPGRQDECSAPILNTVCYCDDFCEQHRGEDCCPDYWSHCKGIEHPPSPITRCYFQGKLYSHGQTFKINCNTCACIRNEVSCEENRCLQEPKLIDEINSDTLSVNWRARNYSEFWGRTLKEGVQLRLGTLNPSRSVYRMNTVQRIYDPETLPREFDARTRWPREVSGVEDQGWCGASWAISTAQTASDRFAVMSKGTDAVLLSAQHLLSCNNKKQQQGCNGGYLDRAWLYMRKFGLVDNNCYPWTGSDELCKIRKRTDLNTAGCPPSINPLRTELYKVGPAYRLRNETDVMQEIITSGPVQATMRVYQDFFSYESGVYRHTPLVEAYDSGYHSVRIIGWGEEFSDNPPIKFWLVVNSWGQRWGENGLFRIERGTNECEIESFVLGAWAKTV